MRWISVALALALMGCSNASQQNHVARDLTVGTGQCSKFQWGTAQMAACLDRAAESQSATVVDAQAGGNG